LLAQKYNKPVVIHCVAAFQEVMILKKIEFQFLIIHGFSKGKLAKQLLDNGFIFRLENTYCAIQNWNQFLRVFKQSIFLGNGYRRRNNSEVYTLAAKYKNITVTEIQKK
jgi:TatD DNase family protein